MDDGGLPIQGYVVEYRPMDLTWIDAESKFWTKGMPSVCVFLAFSG